MKTLRYTAMALAIAGLTGCATVNMDQSMTKLNETTASMTDKKVVLALNDEQRKQLRGQADALLKKPLNLNSTVELMLVNSPEFQALLARGYSESALAAQSGRIPNPIFNFERITVGDELEIGRLFSFGLLDLVTLPWRQQAATFRIERAQLQLAGDVIGQVAQARAAWVDAVVALQKQQYAEQVYENAQASAELAKRMEEVGNFTIIQRIRQQMFYSDAALGLAMARQEATSTREKLVRVLGLDAQQFEKLKLPDRLPDLPATVKKPEEVSRQATARLDVQMAKQAYDAALKVSGAETVSSFVDIEAGIRRDSVFDRDSGSKTNPKGFELDIRLPLFDWGGLRRDALTAELLAKGNALEAVMRNVDSNLRESYTNYRTAYDIAKHYQTEVVPMLDTLAEQNTLRYNGMLIGTFELLADSRNQVRSIESSIDASANFLRAQLALDAALMGSPGNVKLSMGARSPAADAAGGH